jgi:chromosome partitioning protein
VARIIAVVNQKGGVAKTTTTASLGAALAELGEKVLLVDLDPQASLTFSLGIDPEDIELSIRDILLGNTAAFDTMIDTDDYVDLIPATIELTATEAQLVTAAGREYVLKKALATVSDLYDWVLLDCSPSLGIVTLNALTTATDVIVPMHCETLSHRGLGQLLETIKEVKQYTNPELRVLGVLPVMFDGQYEHERAILNDINRTYGLTVWSPVPRSIRFAEAPARGRSILATDPTSTGAMAYRELARTLVSS